ncbi:hypothetical protein GCM10010971_39930 [Silvimonas amylolytica]|uniref:Uncharacterized protein n=1 Tax=Silvimonas amylolytica TaxID=449663 RepID=A0ABQ2PRF0_9NEIS|nr:hypothetical protein GCM10010971_39930 [Silvimonas amylolytica]
MPERVEAGNAVLTLATPPVLVESLMATLPSEDVLIFNRRPTLAQRRVALVGASDI